MSTNPLHGGPGLNCGTCFFWTRPTEAERRSRRGPRGLCGHDDRLSHQTYHCRHYRPKNSNGVVPQDFGATDAEVDWVRANLRDPAAVRVTQTFGELRQILARFEADMLALREKIDDRPK